MPKPSSLEEPEGNRLAIPTQGQIERVVDCSILVILHLAWIDVHTAVIHIDAVVRLLILLCLHLLNRLTLLLLQVLYSLLDRVTEEIVPLRSMTLEPCDSLVFCLYGFD